MRKLLRQSATEKERAFSRARGQQCAVSGVLGLHLASATLLPRLSGLHSDHALGVPLLPEAVRVHC